jgi:hypothetical protein
MFSEMPPPWGEISITREPGRGEVDTISPRTGTVRAGCAFIPAIDNITIRIERKLDLISTPDVGR